MSDGLTIGYDGSDGHIKGILYIYMGILRIIEGGHHCTIGLWIA